MPSLGPWSCTSESCRNRSLPMSSIPILQAASVRYWLWGFPTHKQFELLYLQEMYKQLYLSLPSSAALSDSVAKESCMLNLLLSLPEPNLVTFLFLLDHLKRYKQLNTKINAQKLDMTAHQCAQKERQTKFKNVNFYSWCIRWWSLTSVFSDGFSLHLSPKHLNVNIVLNLRQFIVLCEHHYGAVFTSVIFCIDVAFILLGINHLQLQTAWLCTE